MNPLRSRRGIALPIAIFALVIIGALVAGAFFVGFQEQRVGHNTIKSQQAFAAAEAGAEAQVASWVPGRMNAMAVGSTAAFVGTLAGSDGWFRGGVTRLNGQLFLIRSDGFNADSSARHRVGLIVRLNPIELGVRAALTTRDSVELGDAAFVDGTDHVPSGWTGCDSLPAVAGIRSPDSTEVTANGGGVSAYVSGSPRVARDTTVNAATLTTFGDATFADLAALATVTIGSGPHTGMSPSLNGDGACNTADANNWGDPHTSGPCSTYFPIIYAPGGTKLTGGYGQGVLVVNGNLSVSGGAEFFGPVIVKGGISSTGAGGRLNGGVIAANVNLENQKLFGAATVRYSSCALLRALTNSAPAALLRERSWVDLY